MLTQFSYQEKHYQVNLSLPLDLSTSLGEARCFFAPKLEIQPFQAGDFIGSVKSGAPVNFFDVKLNPHGNGTHTECMGHITASHQSLNKELKSFHFVAVLISLKPEQQDKGDHVVERDSLERLLGQHEPEALVIRTLPNSIKKRTKDYSGTNPAYLSKESVAYIVGKGIKHLILDLPSIDREEDGGKLLGHKTFWHFPHEDRLDCTITELAYIPDEVEDGLYLLNLQTIPLELDACPSRPVLYRMKEVTSSK